MTLTSDKPWACLNCKTRATEDQETCKKCGDRLKAKRAPQPPAPPALGPSIGDGLPSFATPAGRWGSRVKAIETQYAGCRFRSRLEARWAVFLDALKIEWQYEPEGFELPSGWYLPDFRLPARERCDGGDIDVWIEVKGPDPTGREWRLLAELAASTGSHGYMLTGDIPREPDWLGISAQRHCWKDPAGAQEAFRLGTLVRGDFRAIQAALTVARSARFEHGEQG